MEAAGGGGGVGVDSRQILDRCLNVFRSDGSSVKYMH